MHVKTLIFLQLLLPLALAGSSTSTKKPAATPISVGRRPASIHKFTILKPDVCTGDVAFCTASGYAACPASLGANLYCVGWAGCGNWLGQPSCCTDQNAGFRNPGQPTNTSCYPYRGFLEAFRMPGLNTTNTNGFYPQGGLCSLGSANGVDNYYFVEGAAGFITGNPNITLTSDGNTCCPSWFDAIEDWTVTPNSALCIPPVFANGTSSDSSTSNTTTTSTSSSTATSTKKSGGSGLTSAISNGTMALLSLMGILCLAMYSL